MTRNIIIITCNDPEYNNNNNNNSCQLSLKNLQASFLSVVLNKSWGISGRCGSLLLSNEVFCPLIK